MNTFLCRISDSQLLTQFSVTSLQSLSPQPNRPSSIMNFFIFAIFAIFCPIASSQGTFFTVDDLKPGAQMDFNNRKVLLSENFKFRLSLQSDGNLVISTIPGDQTTWSTKTAGSGVTKAVMQTDGQFTLQTASGATVWSTYTRDAGSWLKLQKDGILAVNSPKGYVVWNSATGWGTKTTV